jgi:hypothetical protein
MNNLTLPELVETQNILERRRSERFKIVHILAITGRGTGQIVDISREGLSFGCLYPHKFPDTWPMDILDAKGSHIKQIQVRKIWERTLGHPELSPEFELEIGVEFTDLTASQAEEIDFLLDNLDLFDGYSRTAS